MISIRIEDGEITARLAETSRRLGDLSPVMAEISDALLLSSRKRFASGQDPEGNAWVPRSRTTLDRYAAMKPPRRPGAHPLTVSGGLMKSIFPFSGSDHAGVGASAIYAAAMQFGMVQGYAGETSRGGPIPWGTIPARPFLGLSAKDRTDILDILGDWLAPEGTVSGA